MIPAHLPGFLARRPLRIAGPERLSEREVGHRWILHRARHEVAPLGIRVTALEPGAIRTDWGGLSMTIPEVSEPYQQTVGLLATMIRSTSGQEPLEPHQVARIVRDLAGRNDAPVRLLIGADAYQYGQQAAKALAASDEKWRRVTESVSQT
jgi:NAD(P)-dependent dehydrogenase (short-subunit alcohol dehydrogenase family)